MSSKYTLTIPRGYMLWVQPILHTALISVRGSNTVVWKSPSIYDTDECKFTRDAVLNSLKNHVWDNDHHYAQHAQGFRQRFDNVWAGIVDDRLIGPYLLPLRATVHTYLTFLQEIGYWENYWKMCH